MIYKNLPLCDLSELFIQFFMIRASSLLQFIMPGLSIWLDWPQPLLVFWFGYSLRRPMQRHLPRLLLWHFQPIIPRVLFWWLQLWLDPPIFILIIDLMPLVRVFQLDALKSFPSFWSWFQWPSWYSGLIIYV